MNMPATLGLGLNLNLVPPKSLSVQQLRSPPVRILKSSEHLVPGVRDKWQELDPALIAVGLIVTFLLLWILCCILFNLFRCLCCCCCCRYDSRRSRYRPIGDAQPRTIAYENPPAYNPAYVSPRTYRHEMQGAPSHCCRDLLWACCFFECCCRDDQDFDSCELCCCLSCCEVCCPR